jgi:glycosyltransferase involved in cell wall biosynthesis
MTKKISVILTNYNHSKYIETAIDSIQNQSYSNIELILIDDCSTDGSREKIKLLEKKKFKFPLNTILLEQNKGKWNALNVAIKQASGELITLQDADDANSPYRIELQYEVMQQMKSYHNLCGFIHCYTEDDVQKYKNTNKIINPKVMDHSTVTKFVHLGFKTPGINHYFVGPNFEAHGATCLFYKQLWENGMKFLPGNLGLRCQRAEDSDFNTKMTLLLQKTSIVMEPLYFYRRNTSTNPAWLEEL